MTSTSRIEYFTFEGPLHVAAVVLLACALFALFFWSLRRERQVIGTQVAFLFGTLRTAALLIALWMLLAPATIRTEKSETRKSIAVVVDVSPSMMTVDPPVDAEDARWLLAAQNAGDQNATVKVDCALAAATLAEQSLSNATNSIRNQQAEHIALDAAAAAHDAIERMQVNAQQLAGFFRVSGSEVSNKHNEEVGRILQILGSTNFEQLAKLAKGVRRGHDSFQAGWRESLVDIQHQVTGLRRRLEQLAQQIAADRGVLMDGIDSAALGEYRQSTRAARIAKYLESMEAEVLRPLGETVDIRYASFDGEFRLLQEQSKKPGEFPEEFLAGLRSGVAERSAMVTDVTAAFEQLRQLKQEQPLAAVFLLTDAAHNRSDGRDPRAAAADLSGSPVYVVPIGNTRPVRDVDLKAISAPGVVMKDDEVVVEVTVQAFDCHGESVTAELLRDGEMIQNRPLQFDSANSLQRARFNMQLDEVGLQRFQVRVPALERELSDENNFGQFEVNVIRDDIAVLLADGLPRWEFRYLAQLFRRDTKVECDELLFRPRPLATGRRAETKSFPATVDEWDQYDVVLLGDVSSQNLSVASQESLAAFVRERGGTLVLVAGDKHMPQGYVQQPLEGLLPVTKVDASSKAATRDGYAFQLTEEGWQHHALMIADTQDSTRLAWDFINRNSPLYGLSEYRKALPTARTLIAAVPRSGAEATAEADRNALLCWQPVGRGRVVYLSSPETYRLRFLRGDRLHYRFWGQLLRWAIATDLAGGTQRVTIRTDRPDYQLGEQIDVVVRLKDAAGNAVTNAKIEAAAEANGKRMAVPLQPDDLEPGRYIAEFDRLPPGIYRVQPVGAEVDRLLSDAPAEPNGFEVVTASFTVRAPRNRELLDTRSDRALAQQLADATGGQVLPPTAVQEILALTNLNPIVTESTEVLSLWVQWKFLWVVFGCLFAEWSVRKSMGLS